MAVASILTVYTIEKPLSEDGVEICPSVEYTPSLLRSVSFQPSKPTTVLRIMQPPNAFSMSFRGSK